MQFKLLSVVFCLFRTFYHSLLAEASGPRAVDSFGSTPSLRARRLAAVDFGKTWVRVQLKGHGTASQSLGLVVQDIRNRHWGYPWACVLHTPDEVSRDFDLIHEAHEFEQ
jgi:hypothetical protein